jgi:hypothetical protein
MPPKKSPQPPTDDPQYDLFFYPRLYPSGWSLGEGQSEHPVTPKAEPAPDNQMPFHEPHLFPSGWDLS